MDHRFQEVVPTSNSNNVVALCRIFSMLLSELVKTNPEETNPDDETNPEETHPANEYIHVWIKVVRSNS